MTPKVVRTPRIFSTGDLNLAVPHIAFEILHFRFYGRYANEKLRAFSGAASQAVRYALLLHMRVLTDFFYADPKDDDCSVRHFSILPMFNTRFPPQLLAPTTESKEMKMWLNKLLAHLTATRWESERPTMDVYDRYGLTIETLSCRFEASLPDDMRSTYLQHYRAWEGRSLGTLTETSR